MKQIKFAAHSLVFLLLSLFSTTLYAKKPLDYRMLSKAKVNYNMYTLDYNMIEDKQENVVREEQKECAGGECNENATQTFVRRWRRR